MFAQASILLGMALSIHISSARAASSPITNVTDCDCGFYDPETKQTWTDSAIVYFNETSSIPSDVFSVDSYERQYEKGWNSQYRQGASPSNVAVGGEDGQSLELFCNRTTPAHLVVGGGIQTQRQDIFYGSFETQLRSPQALGSALSMVLHYNDTQSISMDLATTDEWDTAWVSMLTGEEFPERALGVNYTSLQNSTYNLKPWGFLNYRVDWTEKEVKYSINGNVFRTVKKTKSNRFPQTPSPLTLKHWSVGNFFSMMGPPVERSVANVGWVRMFFNSSETTKDARKDFDGRCQLTDMCLADNTNLRGSTPYGEESTLKWKQEKPSIGKRLPALILLIISGAVSFFLIVTSLTGRIPRKGAPKAAKGSHGHGPAVVIAGDASESEINIKRNTEFGARYSSRASSFYHDGTMTPSGHSITQRHLQTFANLPQQGRGKSAVELLPTKPFDSPRLLPRSTSQSSFQSVATSRDQVPKGVYVISNEIQETRSSSPNNSDEKCFANLQTPRAAGASPTDAKSRPGLPAQKQRVDYLAGLVGMSCLLVTAIHFCLTFVPATINPGAYVHYSYESWARKTISSYFLNLIWIGKFSHPVGYLSPSTNLQQVHS